MSNLNLGQKNYLNSALGLKTGYLLNLSKSEFLDLFLGHNIDIENDPKFQIHGTSMGKRMQAFLSHGDDDAVADILVALCSLPDQAFADSEVDASEFRKRVNSFILRGQAPIADISQVGLPEMAEVWRPLLNEEIYQHVEQYLKNDDNFHAVGEALKFVRERMRSVTGEEAATEVFNMNAESRKYYKELFGLKDLEDIDARDADYYRAIGYINLAVQFFRNVNAHELAGPGELRNTFQLLVLASLAIEGISDHFAKTVASEVGDWIEQKRALYPSVASFYREFENRRWVKDLPKELETRLSGVKRAVANLWIENADFTRSYNATNSELMRLQLVSDVLEERDIEILRSKPTVDRYANDQMVGWDDFLRSIGR